MIVRQLFTAGLLVACGVLVTWAAASALQDYAVDKAAIAVSSDQATPYNPGEPRRMF